MKRGKLRTRIEEYINRAEKLKILIEREKDGQFAHDYSPRILHLLYFRQPVVIMSKLGLRRIPVCTATPAFSNL